MIASLRDIAYAIAGEAGLYGSSAESAVLEFQKGMRNLNQDDIQRMFGETGSRIAMLIASAPLDQVEDTTTENENG